MPLFCCGKKVRKTDLLETGFLYGLVGQVFYHNRNKAIVLAYEQMKEMDKAVLAGLFSRTKSESHLNIPRMVGMILLEREDIFLSLFDTEVRSMEQLVLFWQAVHLTNNKTAGAVRQAIRKWMTANLTEKMVMRYRDTVKNIFEELGFRPRLWHGKRLRVLYEYTVNGKNCLPRQRVLKKSQYGMRHDGLTTGLMREMVMAEIELSEIANWTSGLLEDELEEVVALCLPASPISDIHLVERLFPMGVPENLMAEKVALLSNAGYYDCLSAGGQYRASKSETSVPSLKVFLDGSYSMRKHAVAIKDFIGYVQTKINVENLFVVGNEIRRHERVQDMETTYEKGCDFGLALMLLSDGDTFLFVTDGNVDLLGIEKQFRKCRKKARLIIWFLGQYSDRQPNTKNVFHFFGEPEAIHQQLMAFAMMEGKNGEEKADETVV